MNYRDFLKNNTEYEKMIMDNYQILNKINISTKKKKFPYNVLQLRVEPTYKTIYMEMIEGKKFYDKNFPKKGFKGGFTNNEKIMLYFY